MISRIHGLMIGLETGRALLDRDGIVYEVHVPSVDQQRLGAMINETVTLHTLHYLEGQGQGSSFIPRLIGFLDADDREFFEIFTTVKGMGNRKALRALALPLSVVARAIAEKDLDLLVSLPEIGKRTADTIVAQLSGKVDRFVELKPVAGVGAVDAAASELVRDVVTVLVQLGESRTDAESLVTRALAVDPSIEDAERLIEAAFRLKG